MSDPIGYGYQRSRGLLYRVQQLREALRNRRGVRIAEAETGRPRTGGVSTARELERARADLQRHIKFLAGTLR